MGDLCGGGLACEAHGADDVQEIDQDIGLTTSSSPMLTLLEVQFPSPRGDALSVAFEDPAIDEVQEIDHDTGLTASSSRRLVSPEVQLPSPSGDAPCDEGSAFSANQIGN